MKIESIIFDLDNTIYPESEYFKAIIEHFCEEKKIDRKLFDFLFENFDEIRFTKSNIFKYVLEKTGQYSNENQEYLFQLYISIKTKLLPYDGIEDWFLKCASEGLKIGVLTNGIIEAQQNKWESLNLNKNGVVFVPARIIGKDKPNIETFDKFFEKTGFNIQKTIFVGDRFENDLEYGFTHGANCILIGEGHREIPNFENAQEAFLYFKTEFIDK